MANSYSDFGFYEDAFGGFMLNMGQKAPPTTTTLEIESSSYAEYVEKAIKNKMVVESLNHFIATKNSNNDNLELYDFI